MGKIAGLPPGPPVVALGQQPYIVPDGQEPLEENSCVLMPTQQDEIVDEPETAQKKASLSRGSPSISLRVRSETRIRRA